MNVHCLTSALGPYEVNVDVAEGDIAHWHGRDRHAIRFCYPRSFLAADARCNKRSHVLCKARSYKVGFQMLHCFGRPKMHTPLSVMSGRHDSLAFILWQN